LNLVTQAIGINFISDTLRISDLFLGRGSFERAQKIRFRFSIDTWMQDENSQFEVGTKNAYFATYMTLVSTFGYQAPMIIIPIIGYIILITLIDAKNIICVHHKETEDFGNLFRNGLNKIYIGIIIGHLIIMLQAFAQINKVAMSVTIIALAFHIGMMIYIQMTLDNFDI